MELILIRHGKAEERSGQMEDARRELTAEGRKKLDQTMPGLQPFLQNANRIRIWSSRLERAVQTAQIIAGLYKVAQIEYFDFISEGTSAELLAALAKVKTTETVLLVGHEPYLGMWSEQLGGQLLPFRKGSAACFAIASLDPLEAELVWYAQPLALARIARTAQ